MSITLPILTILALIVFSILFFLKDKGPAIKHRITLRELKRMHCDQPPILVTTIKNGRMRETLCYFSAEEKNNEPQVMEIIPDNDFLNRHQLNRKNNII